MQYQPKKAVWEITHLCNMRCKHCGSSAGVLSADELTTEEALKLADDMGSLGLEKVNLSGGEPFLRKDWSLIARRLSENYIDVQALSNGWYLDAETIDLARSVGISGIGISLDGYADTHDFIRTKGSWARAINALKLMKARQMDCSVVTTLNKMNLPELNAMKTTFIDIGVKSWLVQTILPLGNTESNTNLLLDHSDLELILDFIEYTLDEKKIQIRLTDHFGYNTERYNCIMNRILAQDSKGASFQWHGCMAGITYFGIRSNGDMVPCLFSTSPSLVEGNIRQTPLIELWENPNTFHWNRNRRYSYLEGFCKECLYRLSCFGGCANFKQTIDENFQQSYYCLYKREMDELRDKINKIKSVKSCQKKGELALSENQIQVAEFYFSRAQQLSPSDLFIQKQLGYTYYKMKHYERSLELFSHILESVPNDLYAHTMKGASLVYLGEPKSGLVMLKFACEATNEHYMDPFFCLATAYRDLGDYESALEVLKKGFTMSPKFKLENTVLFHAVRQQLIVLKKSVNRCE